MDCRKLYLLFFAGLTSSCSFAHAQNLVPNPSFEDYKKLKCKITQPFDPHQKQTFDSLLYFWTTPSDGGVWLLSTWVNPDCSANTICNIPECTSNPIAFHSYPKDGHNIVGISLLQNYASKQNIRSYIQVPLVSTLVPNTKYLAGCYSMFPPLYYGGEFECNNLGLLFSAQPANPINSDIFNYDPQVNENKINSDSGIWKKLYGCFAATGDEQYLTIGNFKDDNHTEVKLIVDAKLSLSKYTTTEDYSDRLIDSVFTEEIIVPFIPNVITPNGDGLNDKFVIKNIHLGWWSLDVVNRWGKQVYHSSDYRNTWTGDDLSSGVYYYELQHRCPGISYKGAVSILR